MSEVLFSRSIYKEMLNWKDEWSDEYALLVEGARRVGKSTIVRHFAEKEFRTAMIIDFYNPLPGTIEVFNRYSNDYDRLFTELQAIYSVDLYEKESEIVFDEVQQYPLLVKEVPVGHKAPEDALSHSEIAVGVVPEIKDI